MAMQARIKELGVKQGGGVVVAQTQDWSSVKVAKLLIFNRNTSKILGFLIACRLYIRTRLKNTSVKEQIQWVLSYIQRDLADIWEDNIMKNLENESLEFPIVEQFLADLKQEFGNRDNELVKIAELKKVKQGSKTIEMFI